MSRSTDEGPNHVGQRVDGVRRQAAVAATVLLAEGRLQRQDQVIHVLTTKLEDLSPWLRQLGPQSRDFC